MARPEHTAPTVAVRLDYADRPAAIAEIATQWPRPAAPSGPSAPFAAGRTRRPERSSRSSSRSEGLPDERVTELLDELPNLRACRKTKALDKVFGKRLIVVGGGAQIAQAVLGAVSEADRHNLRGEKISVDTIPLVGEENLASAVRAVADLDRARALLLAGSIMGGDITRAVQEIQALGIPVISLNMVGTVTDVADLVVTDPVQAGTMAVMGIADTAKFDFARQKGRRY